MLSYFMLQSLELLVKKRMIAMFRASQTGVVTRLHTRIQDLQQEVDKWRNTAKDLERQMKEVSEKQHAARMQRRQAKVSCFAFFLYCISFDSVFIQCSPVMTWSGFSGAKYSRLPLSHVIVCWQSKADCAELKLDQMCETRLPKLSCAAQQVGIVHFYAMTEIKGLLCHLWWMREWRNLLTSTHVACRVCHVGSREWRVTEIWGPRC